MLFKIKILLFVFLHVCVSAYSCNYTLLETRAETFLGRLFDQIDDDKEYIERNLDFLSSTGNLAVGEREFTALCEDYIRFIPSNESPLIDFIRKCTEIYNESSSGAQKEAVYKLLDKMFEKSVKNSKSNEEKSELIFRLEQKKHLEEEAKIDSLASNLQADSLTVERSVDKPHSPNKEISIVMESPARTIISDICVISLNSTSFNPSSIFYYKKQMKMMSYPIRIFSNLQDIKCDLLDSLGEALGHIDSYKELVEIILTNGSSIKFNRLFNSYLSPIYNAHYKSGKQITIVFSTTSESQRAYEKLYTLREVDTSPHYSLDSIAGVSPITITSPSKPNLPIKREPRIIDVSDSDISDTRISNTVDKLNELNEHVTLYYSPPRSEEFNETASVNIGQIFTD